ncbi:hypothetical protein BH24CHL7_BH24CHL7_12120 [soil metagenome]|jgi:hypothetical protein
MLALIGSFFGIVVYMALFADFGRAQGALILSVILAHQRFLHWSESLTLPRPISRPSPSRPPEAAMINR